MRFLLHGNGEGLKGAVHGAAELLSGAMCAYNAAALAYRVVAGTDGTPGERLWRNRHLAANAAVYVAAYAWERRKRQQHENASGSVQAAVGAAYVPEAEDYYYPRR